MKELPADRSTEERVLQGLSRIGVALRSQAWQAATPRGLNPTQAQILVLLRRSPEPHASISALAEQLAVAPATVSESVSTLERKGLIEKGRSPEDRRVVTVSLTDEGREEADASGTWPDFLLGTVHVLDQEERRVFLRSIVKMIRTLQESGQIPAGRMCVTCRYFRPNVHDDPARPHHCAFVDAAFGDGDLRVDCPEHEIAADDVQEEAWLRFLDEFPSEGN